MTQANDNAIVPKHDSINGRELLLFHAKDKGKGGLLSRNPCSTLSLDRIASRADSFTVPVDVSGVDGVGVLVVVVSKV